jgi:putative ABC transport system permease protein
VNLPKLALRNLGRNRTRTLLTVIGVMVAVLAFGFLRTVITAYYAGAAAASKDRLVVRNATSLVVPVPIAYRDQIARLPGVTRVATADWFGGVYKEKKNFFPNFAVDAEPYLELYPEFQLTPDEKAAFLRDRTGCVVGEKLAQKYGWKVGDQITLRGSIYTGDWTFTLRGIYHGRDRNTNVSQMFFQWKYLDERQPPEFHGLAGLYVVGIADPSRTPEIIRQIDGGYKGSPFETLTETEEAFQLGFLSMVTVILGALKIVSAFVLVVIALILGNTIAMSVRERTAEIAILKALGFSGERLALTIAAESALLGAVGGLCGIALAVPVIKRFGAVIENEVGAFFPVFQLESSTVLAMFALSIVVGLLAAIVPATRVGRVTVSSALRNLG